MRQWMVDAFAERPFRGNPACVLEPFDAWPASEWMQNLAAENNQAETAFLLRTDDPSRFGLRWMTPALEVPLCGHATLACAHVLFEEVGSSAETLTFDTRSGPLTVRRAARGLEMDFPADGPVAAPAPDGLAEALGARPVEVWLAAYLIVVLESEAAIRGLKPDIAALHRIASASADRGNVGVAALADPGRPFDVVDRFFAPGSGVPEDPATGSMHCILAPLFADKLGRSRVRFHQAYPGRGADIETEMKGGRVLLRGQAVTVVESRLRLDPDA
jgi:PhzF family phenazine biosynthesis protein